MPHSLDQVIPSLQSLGMWTYLILSLAVMLEAIVLTGVMIPGTMLVMAGGVLVHQGVLNYFALVGFVAIGTALGSEISFRIGRLTAGGLRSRTKLGGSSYTERARALLNRYGGFALVIGRFFGPLSAFVPFTSALAEMPHRRFLLWNVTSSLIFGLVIPAIGYFFGSALRMFGPLTTRVALFLFGAGLILVVLWFLFARIQRAWPFVQSLAKSLTRLVVQYPVVRRWADRHPRVASFVANRTNPHQVSGLLGSVLGVLFIYLLAVYIGSVIDFVGAREIFQIDTKLASLLAAFRDSRLIAVFAAITALGDSRSVAILLVTISVAMVLIKRPWLAAGLVLAVVGQAVSVQILKTIFHRARPAAAYFVENGNSFPSGHSTVAVALFGMMCFIAIRLRLMPVLMAGLLAITVIFGIGLSRIYLIEHYLSDVLNGYLVGAMWLVIGIGAAELMREKAANRVQAQVQASAKRVATALVLIGFAAVGYISATYSKPLNAPATIAGTPRANDIPAMFKSGAAPAWSETIFGARLDRVNLVLIAKDAPTLRKLLARAGWVSAQPPGVLNVMRMALPSWLTTAGAEAGVTPAFWNGVPNDLAFKRRGSIGKAKGSLQLRVWSSDLRTSAGATAFAAATSIAPSMVGMDTPTLPDQETVERGQLIKDLTATGLKIAPVEFDLIPKDQQTGSPQKPDTGIVILDLTN